jgi:hypothetical protein
MKKALPFSRPFFTGLALAVGLLARSGTAQAQQTPVVFDSVYATTPVRLVYFTADLYYGGGQLHWTTMGEGDSRAFDIEQSSDGRSWQLLSSMQAHPGHPTRYDYVYMDLNLDRYAVPVVYYRLRLLARNGRYTYSPVRRIGRPDTTARR